MKINKKLQRREQKALVAKSTVEAESHWFETLKKNNYIAKPKELIIIYKDWAASMEEEERPLTRTAFANHIKVSEEVLFEKLINEPEYKEVLQDIDQRIKGYLIEKILKNKVNVVFGIFLMKNTYKWKDGNEKSTGTGTVTLNINIPPRRLEVIDAKGN